MPLFGGSKDTTLDDRLVAVLAESYGDKSYEKYLRKAALKEQTTVISSLRPDEQIVFLGNGEGVGHAGIVAHMSAIVVTTQRLMIIRGGKVRQSVLRGDIKTVSADRGGDGKMRLYVGDGSETVGFEFESIQRRDALMRALDYEPTY